MSPSLSARTRFWARVVLPFYLLALGWIVFAPGEDAERATGVVAWVAEALAGVGVAYDPAYVVLEFLANIVLFVPFGALIALSLRLPWWAVVALGFAVSVAIELVQLALPTRHSTILDVIANTTGAGVGVLLVAALIAWRHRARRAPRSR